MGSVLGPAVGSIYGSIQRILRHPANRGRRGRALALYVAWQVWERLVRRPWTIRLGTSSRIRLYPHATVAALVLYCRIPDYEELSFVEDYLESGDLFVDVGANVGVYSLWASEADGVDVLAFEPSSSTCNRILENVRLNGLDDRVTVRRQAVGAKRAQVQITTGLDAVNQLVVDGTTSALLASEVVEQTTLDDALDARAPALIKIDVEGGELDVLRGGRECITLHRPALIVEVNDPEGLSEVFGELGYRTWSYDPVERELRPAAPALRANVLALADIDAARARLKESPTRVPTGPPPDRTPLPHGLKAALLNRLPLLRLYLLRRDFLRESGWLASGQRNAPVGRNGNPLPWYTYPTVDFLQERVRPDMTVFEYGAGNSTL